MIRDKHTSRRIKALHPKIRKEVERIIDECNRELTGPAKVRISQGLRTIAEQDALYSLGRTKPGKRVTNARGGQSIHNYGLAVDIVLIINNSYASWDVKKDWDGDRQSDWMEVVHIFKKHGWKWGGDWRNFKDMPHFEKTFGHNWRTLMKSKKDANGYPII